MSMASSMSPPVPKWSRRTIDPLSMSLRSSKSSEKAISTRISRQQGAHRRIPPRNRLSSIPKITPRAATEDFPTDPEGFFADDLDHGNNLQQETLPPVLEKQPTIEEISVAVDFGTENSAVTYKLHYKGQNLRPQPGRDQILRNIEKVAFANRSYVKTQIGWHSETLQILYGYEVDDAIRRGKLLRGSRIQGVKLTLLDPSGQTRAERSRLEKQLKEIHRTVRLVQHESGSRHQMRKLTPEDLVSEFIGYLVRHCLQQIYITTGGAGLQWPNWGVQPAFRDLDPAIVAKVVLFIAVPSLATSEFVDLIIAAAQRAGFSDATVFPEPACAQQFLLQKDFETSQGRDGNLYSGASIILDIGGGTADLQTLSIVKYNPTEIKEEVLGDGGFFGGRYVNSLLREHAEERIGNQMEWLVSQLCYPGYEVNRDEILDHLVAEFEEAKQNFDYNMEYPGYEDLPLPGRPYKLNRPDRGLVGQVFRLSRDAFIEILTKQAKKLIKLIDKQIRLFQDRIRRIILVGGCSRCDFLREYLKGHYDKNEAAGYSISVMAPEAETALTIATGVLLAGFDENFISERYLRRSYGVIWERAVKQLRDPHTPHIPEICPYDKVLITRDMSKFLLKIGQRVQRQFSTALSDNYGTSQFGRAWRAIPHERKYQNIKLIETIIYSDHESNDDLWIWEPSHKISLRFASIECLRLTLIHIRIAGTIEIRLTHDECRAFSVERHPDNGKEFYYMEYEVILRGDGMRMVYEFLIPRTGRFEGRAYGENPIRKTCTLTLASAFAFYTSPEDLT